MTQMKAIFLMINIVVAMIAFSWNVEGAGMDVTVPAKLTNPFNNQPLSSADKLAKTPSAVAPNAAADVAAKGTSASIQVGDKVITGTMNAEKTALVTADGTKYTWSNPGSATGQWNPAVPGAANTPATSQGPLAFLGQNAASNLLMVGLGFGIGYLIGEYVVEDNGMAIGTSLAAGIFSYQIFAGSYGTTTGIGKLTAAIGAGPGTTLGTYALPLGIGIGAAVLIMMYRSYSTDTFTINCLPWQAPTGGNNCEVCNKGDLPCSEYRCRSLGQSCEIVNAGTENELCVNVNPNDVQSPGIDVLKNDDVPTEGHSYIDVRQRPPGDGSEPGRARIVRTSSSDGCIAAFTPLEFGINLTEPAQCKIDINHTENYDAMAYYMGGSNQYSYAHTDKLSLPSPSSIALESNSELEKGQNASGIVLQNDGTYSLYIRCMDRNGNQNQGDEFVMRFCVDDGPDTTPPIIKGYNINSSSPVQYNKTSVKLQMYVNEPAECRWSRVDQDFDNMEYNFTCNNRVWEMNSELVYTCDTTLRGIMNEQINNYYFRCKDQPRASEGRNENTESAEYIIVGTQPLTIESATPNGTVYGSSDSMPIFINVTTDYGYSNGASTCYYSTTGLEADYVAFSDNTETTHSQRQDLIAGDYTYYLKCVDLGGNAAYTNISFKVDLDYTSPQIVRAYQEAGSLKILTDENSICSYSFEDCDFKVEDGIMMTMSNSKIHTGEWKSDKDYYIRCEDIFKNEPDLKACSIILTPQDLESE